MSNLCKIRCVILPAMNLWNCNLVKRQFSNHQHNCQKAFRHNLKCLIHANCWSWWWWWWFSLLYNIVESKFIKLQLPEGTHHNLKCLMLIVMIVTMMRLIIAFLQHWGSKFIALQDVLFIAGGNNLAFRGGDWECQWYWWEGTESSVGVTYTWQGAL